MAQGIFYVNISILAIIVTGDWGNAKQSVEVLKADGTSWCTLPDLPERRQGHTQSGLIACGGFKTLENCVRFSNGHWNISHENLFYQIDHCAWSSSKHGTRILGGSYNAELLADDGTTPDSFPLKYYTM